nr:polyhomeotic-like protein 2 [Dermacentor andersoni]
MSTVRTRGTTSGRRAGGDVGRAATSMAHCGQRDSSVSSRRNAERWLSSVAPAAGRVGLSVRFGRGSHRMVCQAVAGTHSFGWRVVQEESEPSTIGLRAQRSPRAGLTTGHVRAGPASSASAVRDSRRAIGSPNVKPAVVERVPKRDPAVTSALACARGFTREPAPSLARNEPPPPPVLTPYEVFVALKRPPLPSPPRGHCPEEWTVEDVAEYVARLPGCERYAEKFRDQEIDGEALFLLNERHLMSAMNMKLGPAVKMCAMINSLREVH